MAEAQPIRERHYRPVPKSTYRHPETPFTPAIPKGFFIGVGDADLQVAGHTPDSVTTIWDAFTKRRGITPPGDGIQRYSRWKEDVALMKELGIHEYRTSISMSRILKEDGSVNQEAVDWYKNYFKELKNSGMNIYATLYHWELPNHLEEKGGWKNRETIDWTVKHAKAVATNLGEYIDEYFLFNEPWCSSFLSYHLGITAPGHQNLQEALQAAHILLVAHGKTFDAIKEVQPDAKISTVLNVEPDYPASNQLQDIEAAEYANEYVNEWFLRPLFRGEYPTKLTSLFGDKMPHIQPGDMEAMKIGDKLTTLGINYYRPAIAKWDSDSDVKYTHVVTDQDPVSDIGFTIYPPGLYDMLKQINDEYRPRQLYVAENGMALETQQSRKKIPQDTERVLYLREHLNEIFRARRDGVPINGYFVWTLMKNYEWSSGYDPKANFGLVDVNTEDGSYQRIPKESYYWLQDVLREQNLMPTRRH